MSNSDQKLVAARVDGRGHNEALRNTLAAYGLARFANLLRAFENIFIY